MTALGVPLIETYELKPNQLQLGFLKVYSRARTCLSMPRNYGIVYHDKPPYEVMSTKWLSFDDVIKIERVEEMLEVYYNSGRLEYYDEAHGVYL